MLNALAHKASAPLLASVALLSVSSQIQALTLESCQWDQYIGEFSHRDLGGGVVSFVEGVHDHKFHRHTLVLVACSSGQRLDVPTDDTSWETANKFDRYDRVHEILDEAEASATPYTLADLAELYRAEFGSDAATLSNDPVETCACAAAYPLMRGSKKKHEPLG